MVSKRSFSRRAWLTLAWTLVWFIAGQVVIRAWLQSNPEIADPEFGRKLVDLREAIRRQPDRPLVLMLGSSRVATGFRPGVLPSARHVRSGPEPMVFNFAQVGSGPEMAHLSLQRLLDQGIRPDWVLIELWPPTWGAERGAKEFMDQVNVDCLGWKDVRLLGQYLPRPRRFYRQWWNAQVVPLFSQRDALVRHIAPSWALTPAEPDRRCENLDHLGWWSPTPSVNPQERARLVERYRKVYERRLQRFHVAKTPDRALRQMIALCDRERIRATVVVLPEGEEFRRLYPSQTLTDVADYLERVRHEYRVQVIDARDWVGDAGFMDGHHLLPEGATVFTRRLGREVIQPLLAESASPTRR